MSKKSNRFSPEVRERTVRMALELNRPARFTPYVETGQVQL